MEQTPKPGDQERGRIRRFFKFRPAETGFTILALIIWAFIHDQYGITWDEPGQVDYGEAVWKYWFGHLSFSDFSHQNVQANLYYYNPALSLLCAVISHTLNADIYRIYHAIQGLIWVAMFYPACALGRRVYGHAGAWCTGLALLGLPTLLGQAFNNPKDIPLACAALWLLHVSAGCSAARTLGWPHILKLGLAMGFVLAIRPGAWFLCALLGLVPLAGIWRASRQSRDRNALSTLGKSLPVVIVAFLIGWGLMILPWPNAWQSPISFPMKSASYAAHFDTVYPVLFQGQHYPSNRLPWNYLPGYLTLTLPIPILILTMWGHLVLWRRAIRSISAAMATAGIMFLIWLPLISFIILRPNIYDGMRHFFFILPPVALTAGIAAADLMRNFKKMPIWAAKSAAVILLLSALPVMVRLHPYENVYFNFLAGPRDTLSERYETDYWLSSYREAAEWINEAQSRFDRQLSVGIAASASCDPCFMHFVDKRIKVSEISFGVFPDTNMPSGIDYYVATTRLSQSKNFPGEPIAHQIEREGILLTVIKGNPRQ